MSDPLKKNLVGIFENEKSFLSAAKTLRDAGLPVHDAYTPYAVHGLDDFLGIKRSRLPYVTFGAGLSGGLFAIFFQLWTFSSSWPVNVGGKPLWAVPAFIPVTFELTVLIGGLTTAAAFLLRAGLFPSAKAKLADERVTNDRFVLAFSGSPADDERVKKIFKDCGVVTIRQQEVVS